MASWNEARVLRFGIWQNKMFCLVAQKVVPERTAVFPIVPVALFIAVKEVHQDVGKKPNWQHDGSHGPCGTYQQWKDA